MPDHLRMYFDFEAYGRDMEIEGHFIETDSGIVEIINY
jgi:antirestriction protein